MNKTHKDPIYNLKVVVRETGIKPDTLRAWERRYGLPEPERTPGGHRLYSQHDIEAIKWLQARQEEGLRINQAVDLWKNMHVEGQTPLSSTSFSGGDDQAVASPLLAGETLDEMRAQWVGACLDFDEPKAENILAQAFARYPLETVCLSIMQKGIAEIGAKWYTGESTIQQEHFSSSLMVRRLDALLATAPAPTRGKRILISCPPGEEHIISPLLVTVFLRYRGYDVIYLGANVPIAQLGETVDSTHPDLIVMTAQQLTTAAGLYEAAVSLMEKEVPIGFGGLVFNLMPRLRELIPGFYLGETLEKAVQEIGQLIAYRVDIPEIKSIPGVYQEAVQRFHQKRPLIEADIWEQFQHSGIQGDHLEQANKYLGDDIEASIILGDLGLLAHEIDWVRSLLENQNAPQQLLPEYLKLYKKAIEKHLGDSGRPIVDWLEGTISEQVALQRQQT